MKRILQLQIFFVFLLISSAIYGQDIIYKKIQSLELGATRTLKIYVPASYKTSGTRLYPLSILFDGDYLFDVYTGNAKLFALRDKAPEQIIVGILQNENKERYVDCSYNKVNGLPTEDSDKFYKFVRIELLDYLESKYRLSPFRTLVGNTLTANFVNYFTVENQPVFDAFININPYYNDDMSAFLQNKLSMLEGQKVYYYLSSGTYQNKKKQQKIEEVHYILNMLNNPNVAYKYDNFKNSTKIASIGQSIPSAMAHIFDIYSAISKEEFAQNIEHLSPPDAIAYLENKYVEIEYLFGTNMNIRERDIFAIESIVIDQENGDYLVSFGEMIQRLYPETPISDYYIGMFYEKNGRYKQALKHYKNGYAKIDENSDDAESYYQNIERVLNRQDDIVEEKELEKKMREAEKEMEKINREEEKALRKIENEKRKEEKNKIEIAKRKQWEEEKEQKKIDKENNKIKEEALKKEKQIAWEKEKHKKEIDKENAEIEKEKSLNEEELEALKRQKAYQEKKKNEKLKKTKEPKKTKEEIKAYKKRVKALRKAEKEKRAQQEREMRERFRKKG